VAGNLPNSSVPASQAIHQDYTRTAVFFGVGTATLALFIYAITSFYSASDDFGTSAGALVGVLWLTGCAAAINAVLFYLTGRDTWKNITDLDWHGARNRLALMLPGLLPASIFLALVLKATAPGQTLDFVPTSIAWPLGIAMMALRVILNGQALEHFYYWRRGNSRFLQIAVNIGRDYQARGWEALIWPISMTVLALIYTVSAHAKISAALTFIFGSHYGDIPIEAKYLVEAIGCLFLAPLNVLWTLTNYLSNQSLPILGRRVISTELLATIRDVRSDRWIRNKLWLTLIVSSGFSAIATVIMGSTPSPDDTTFSFEAIRGMQIFLQIVAFLIGSQMNANSTWMYIYEKQATLDAIAYVFCEMINDSRLSVIDIETITERLKNAEDPQAEAEEWLTEIRAALPSELPSTRDIELSGQQAPADTQATIAEAEVVQIPAGTAQEQATAQVPATVAAQALQVQEPARAEAPAGAAQEAALPQVPARAPQGSTGASTTARSNLPALVVHGLQGSPPFGTPGEQGAKVPPLSLANDVSPA
jgi:hypothetical protein